MLISINYHTCKSELKILTHSNDTNIKPHRSYLSVYRVKTLQLSEKSCLSFAKKEQYLSYRIYTSTKTMDLHLTVPNSEF